MSADLLRRAASVLRERAEAATPGPWWQYRDEAEMIWYGDEALTYRMDETPAQYDDTAWDAWADTNGQLLYGDVRRTEDAAYIATMGPRVGLALADWLDAEADGFELYEATARVVVALDGGARLTHSTHQEALAVARAVLGEQP